MIRELIRTHGAAWLMTLVAAAMALPLTGCVAPDDDMNLVHRQNLAMQQATPADPNRPMEGGSAVRGMWAVRRYETGNVRPPTTPPAPAETAPITPDAPLPK